LDTPPPACAARPPACAFRWDAARGYSLPTVYFIWVVVVVSMYPLCCWFAALKQRRHDGRLSYL
jgi:hypothetical protein